MGAKIQFRGTYSTRSLLRADGGLKVVDMGGMWLGRALFTCLTLLIF